MRLSSFLLIFALCISSSAMCQTDEEIAALQLMRANKNDEAIAAFSKIVNANPQASHSMNAMAVLYYRKNDYPSSYKMASRGLSVDKDDPDLAISLALAGIKLSKADESISGMDALIAKNPSFAMAYYIRAKALDAKDMIQQAIGAYSKTIQAQANFDVVYYDRGKDFLAIRRYDDALKDFTKYISTTPNIANAYYNRGIVYFRLKNYDAAIEDYNKVLSIDSKNADGLTGRGITFIAKKQPDPAKTDFKKAIELDPKQAEAYYGLAKIYGQEKNYTEALQMAEKCVQLQPGSPVYLSTYCGALIHSNRDKEAIGIAKKILSINDAYLDGYMLEATAESNISDFASAMQTLNTGISKLPENYLLYSLRANIYRQQGNTSAAAADEEKAKNLATK